MAFNDLENYYEILGVSVDSTYLDIKSAYRKLARKYHPDINKAPDAIEKFKNITTAYETLSNPVEREKYNTLKGFFRREKTTTSSKRAEEEYRAGAEKSAQTNTSKVDDSVIYKNSNKSKQTSNEKSKTSTAGYKSKTRKNEISPFKFIKYVFAKFKKYKRTRDNHKPVKGDNITTDITITPEEVITGSKRIIHVLTTQNCPKCFGHRFVNGGKCSECKGSGEISTRKKIIVTIPKGIKDGAKLRLKGEGASGKNGGPSGDLYINVKVETKSKFSFDKLNIYYTVPITPFEAALGEEITIPCFDGKIKLKLPKNTCSGQKFRIAKQGIKKNGKIGDLIVTVSIEFSHDLSEDEIKLYEKLKILSKDDVRKNLQNEY